ncbi:hypothetical protein AAC387_Pa02g3168 [Persea americana]
MAGGCASTKGIGREILYTESIAMVDGRTGNAPNYISSTSRLRLQLVGRSTPYTLADWRRCCVRWVFSAMADGRHAVSSLRLQGNFLFLLASLFEQ